MIHFMNSERSWLDRMTKPQNKRVQLALWKKLLFSFLATVIFFVMLEILLTMVGVRVDADTSDPFVGFSNRLPLFVESVDESGQVTMVTAENKLHWFNRQSFPKAKAAGTKRIFCLGGSTTYGHPYWDETSFSGWMRRYLPEVDASQSWEVINAGGISYASYRVAALMEELVNYEPDIFVVYSAHNEFLERRTYANMFEQSSLTLQLAASLSRTRVWTITERAMKRLKASTTDDKRPSDILPDEVDEMLNHTIGPTDYHRDSVWQAKVVAHYEANLRRMVALAKKANARIVFVAPAVNEKNCSPFKSQYDDNLSDGDRTQVETLMGTAQASLEQSNPALAMEQYRSALKLDEHYAELHYRIGLAQLQNQQTAEARQSLQRAIDEDVCPLRATSAIQKAIRRVSQDLDVPIVEFEDKLRRFSEEQFKTSIFGEEVFMDHVHPTIEANRRLGMWVIELLQDRKLVGGTSINAASIVDRLEALRLEVMAGLDLEDEAFALRNLAKVLHWAGKYEEAIPRAQDTLELVPGDPESRYIVASCYSNLGKTQLALEEYDLLFRDGVGFPRAYQPYGELLASQGDLEQAKAYLLLAILRNPENASAYRSLGEVHNRLQEYQFAKEALAESLRLAPGNEAVKAELEKANTQIEANRR